MLSTAAAGGPYGSAGQPKQFRARAEPIERDQLELHLSELHCMLGHIVGYTATAAVAHDDVARHEQISDVL